MNFINGESITMPSVVFDPIIRMWQNKDIVFHYKGYGGVRFHYKGYEGVRFHYKGYEGVRKVEWNSETRQLEYVGYVGDVMIWEMDKQYKARVLYVSSSYMFIRLENGYEFSLYAGDFRDVRIKDKFAIYEV